MAATFDAIVIGAGVVGTSTAFQLCRHGLKKVLILEKAGGVGAGSSGSSSAVLRTRYSTDEISLMAKEGLEAFSNWRDYLELTETRGTMQKTGVLWMMGEGRDALETEKVRYKKLGIRTEVLSHTDFTDRFPSFSPCQNPLDLTGEKEHTCEDKSSFFFEPDGGYFDPVGANQDFLEAARKKGAQVEFNQRVTSIKRSGNQVTGVGVASGETFEAPVVINASGPWCNELIEEAGLKLNWTLEPTRIQCCVRKTPENFHGQLPVFGDAAGGIYGRAEARGQQILFGSILEEDEKERITNPDDFHTSCDPDYRDIKLHALHHRIKNCQGRGEATGYAALYTINREDMHPVIGESELKGFYLANGFSGHGFKLSPPVGSLVAHLVTDQQLPGDTTISPEFLSPKRQPIDLETKNVLA